MYSDFRSPGTGLYSNLQKYNLPKPEAVFDINYFREHPKAFCMLAKEMWPDNFSPTPTHFFIKLLEEKGLLKRCFTQNIDTLERAAGVSPERLVEAHGSFGSCRCIVCGRAHEQDWIRAELEADKVPACLDCSGLVKPDIVFFGEALPERFAELRSQDLPSAELLLVLGTSLTVAPFCTLVGECPANCPRLLLNKTKVGTRQTMGPDGFRFDEVTDSYSYRFLLT